MSGHKREKFVFLSSEQAEQQLVEWLKYDADLDDLARIVSLVRENGRVVVVGPCGNSDEFKDGRRCRNQLHLPRKDNA